MSVTWEDVKNLEADLREQAALETETAAQKRMTPQEVKDDLAFQRARRQADRAEWAARWPHHCRNCEGAGAFTVVTEDGTDGEACEACQGRPCRCPRCGTAGVSIFGQKPCACGWTYGGPDAVMPSAAPIRRWEDEQALEAGEFTDPFSEE